MNAALSTQITDFLNDEIDGWNFQQEIADFLTDEIDSFNSHTFGTFAPREWEQGWRVDDPVIVEHPTYGVMGGWIFSETFAPAGSSEQWFMVAMDDGSFMSYPVSELS